MFKAHKKILTTAGVTLLAMIVAGLLIASGLELYLLAFTIIPIGIKIKSIIGDEEFILNILWDDPKFILTILWHEPETLFNIAIGLVMVVALAFILWWFGPAFITLMSGSLLLFSVVLPAFILSVGIIIDKLNTYIDKYGVDNLNQNLDNNTEDLDEEDKQNKSYRNGSAVVVLGLTLLFAIVITNLFVPIPVLTPFVLNILLLSLIGLNALNLVRNFIGFIIEHQLNQKLIILAVVALLMAVALFQFGPLILSGLSATTIAAFTMVLIVTLIYVNIKSLYGANLYIQSFFTHYNGLYTTYLNTESYYRLYKYLPKDSFEWLYLISITLLIVAIVWALSTPLTLPLNLIIFSTMVSASLTCSLIVVGNKTINDHKSPIMSRWLCNIRLRMVHGPMPSHVNKVLDNELIDEQQYPEHKQPIVIKNIQRDSSWSEGDRDSSWSHINYRGDELSNDGSTTDETDETPPSSPRQLSMNKSEQINKIAFRPFAIMNIGG